jgi:hypothetical protein
MALSNEGPLFVLVQIPLELACGVVMVAIDPKPRHESVGVLGSSANANVLCPPFSKIGVSVPVGKLMLQSAASAGHDNPR